MVLKGDEAALVAAAVAGKSLTKIAVAAGVSVSTAQRRLQDPAIQAAIRAGLADRQRQAVGRLGADLNPAIRRLRQLVAHEDPKIALQAIDKLLSNAHRFSIQLEARPAEAPSSPEESGDA